MYIDGEWVESNHQEKIAVWNPSTGQKLEEIPSASIEDVRRAVDAAKSAFESGRWSRLTPADRANILLKIATMLEEQAQEFARLESLNSGKSIKQTTNYDVPYSIDNIRFLAGASRVLEGKAMSEYVPDGTSAVRREPIGVVGIITPWNYPLMMVVWRAFPALAVGNTVIVKPATYTPLTTLELARLMEKAGIPRGVFNVVTGPGKEVGRRLSELGAGTVKKVSLELGGKAPFIVFDDADIEAATESSVVGGLVNNGQDCANSTRYYVHESIIKKYLQALLRKLSTVRIGNALNNNTDLGPLISESHRERVEGYIKIGIEEGAELLHGGKRPHIEGSEGGYYLEPVVLFTENQDSTIVKEEIFGPVFTVLTFTSYDDVIEKSNDVVYGLGASVWTKDLTRAMNAVRDLRFGTVWVNEHLPIPSEMPWAGYKQSGHGASMSTYYLEEFTNIKHVYFDLTGKERKGWYYQIYGDKDQ